MALEEYKAMLEAKKGNDDGIKYVLGKLWNDEIEPGIQDSLTRGAIMLLSDEGKANLICEGKLDLRGKDLKKEVVIFGEFNEEEKANIAKSMKDPNAIIEILKRMKDKYIILDIASKLPKPRFNEVINKLSIGRETVEAWEKQNAEKVAGQENKAEQPVTVPEPDVAADTSTERELENENKKKTKRFSLNLGEYGKYVKYIERGEATPETVGSIFKTGFSQSKEISLLELLVKNMKDESQMIAAFDAIGDPQKKVAVIEKLSASKEKICEILLEKNPELKVELDKPKENGDKKTLKGFIKEAFSPHSQTYKKYLEHIQSGNAVPGLAETIETLSISKKEKEDLIKKLVDKLGPDKEPEILKYQEAGIAKATAAKEEKIEKGKLTSVLGKLEHIEKQDLEKSKWEKMFETLQEKLATLTKGKEAMSRE